MLVGIALARPDEKGMASRFSYSMCHFDHREYTVFRVDDPSTCDADTLAASGKLTFNRDCD